MTNDVADPPPPGGRNDLLQVLWSDWYRQDNSANVVIQQMQQRVADFVADVSTQSTPPPLPLIEANQPTGTGAGSQETAREIIIGQSVAKNIDHIKFVGQLFLALIDEYLDELKSQRLNIEEAARHIDELEEFKRRVEAFLATASDFVAQNAPDQMALKLSTELKKVWASHHAVMVNTGLAAMLAVIFHLTDPISTIAAGAIVGGRPLTEVLKAYFGRK